MNQPEWWHKPRKISVVVDNDSWILSYAERLVNWCAAEGDSAKLCRTHEEVAEGAVAFYLGCVKITPSAILKRNRRNLVVHASDLPKGRGFSPWTYAVLEGAKEIPICLIEAVQDVDAGPIIYKNKLALQGTELVRELRSLIGEKTLELAQLFLQEAVPPEGSAQKGSPTTHARRTGKDSRLDPEKTIAEQFDLLRVVDNERYPAFFRYRGRNYKILIEPDNREDIT